MRNLREEKKAATREALSRSAVEIAMREGLELATVSAIAKEANVSTRTFHNYFVTRDEALFEYVANSFSILNKKWAEMPVASNVIDDLELLVVDCLAADTKEFNHLVALFSLAPQLQQLDLQCASKQLEEIEKQTITVCLTRFPGIPQQRLTRILRIAKHAIGLALVEYFTALKTETESESCEEILHDYLDIVRKGVV